MVEKLTKYEVARIVGARALQIAMDAPLLVKISDKELEEVHYDPLRIAKIEINADVLPITVHRPMPKKRNEKLREMKGEKINDDKIIAKEREVEDEISEKADEMGFASEDDAENIEGNGNN